MMCLMVMMEELMSARGSIHSLIRQSLTMPQKIKTKLDIDFESRMELHKGEGSRVVIGWLISMEEIFH